MARHTLLFGISEDRKGVLLFRKPQFQYWNGLAARVADVGDTISEATRIFETVTKIHAPGWTKLAVIKDEAMKFTVHVLFCVFNQETEAALRAMGTESEDGDFQWDWWNIEEMPPVMNNMLWLVPLVFDRQMKRPIHVVYQSDNIPVSAARERGGLKRASVDSTSL